MPQVYDIIAGLSSYSSNLLKTKHIYLLLFLFIIVNYNYMLNRCQSILNLLSCFLIRASFKATLCFTHFLTGFF